MAVTDFDLDSMNETDVREIIVRPFLHAMGYRQGSAANILTEKTLRYDKAFLGRKNPSRDPPLVGRADYICQATSYGRWVVEVKKPQADLTRDDAEQAHTYAAHPEVAATYYVLTNGRRFQLFRTSHPDTVELEWGSPETAHYLPILRNILSPESIKKASLLSKPDTDMPLAPGEPSRIRLVGGTVTYEDHHSSSPLFVLPDTMKGARASVSGDRFFRSKEGLISGRLTLKGPYVAWDTLNQLAGIEGYDFSTADHFVSDDVQKPTIFQNFLRTEIPAGTMIPPIPGQTTQSTALPFACWFTAATEAVGFLQDSRFQGVFSIEYGIGLEVPPGLLPAGFPTSFEYTGNGVFDILYDRDIK